MSQPGKSFEQVMEELNHMVSNWTGKKGKKGSDDDHEQTPPANKGLGAFQWVLLLAFALIYGAISSFYKIETTQQGVITRFGAYHGIADEGPHFKLPFGIDQVYKVEVTRIHEEQFGFRKEGDLHKQQARQESLMLTGDLKVAVVEWILQYKIHDAKKYLFNAVNVDKNIRDISVSVMRRAVGDKLVTDVLTTDRIFIAEQARKFTQETLDRFDMGVTITNLNLQNVTPPEDVRAAFNEVNIARQEADQMINQAKGTYNRVIPEAEGKAAQVISEAEGYAIKVVNNAKGDTDRFRSILKAYQNAPEITKKRMYLETMEEIFSQTDRFTIVDPKIQGVLPIYSKLNGHQDTSAAGTKTPESK